MVKKMVTDIICLSLILEMNVVEFLNAISYYKSKQDYERMIIKMNRAK